MTLLLILLLAGDPVLPAGVTCSQVRTMVAEFGYLKSIIWARGHGYTWPEIAQAKKCLKN